MFDSLDEQIKADEHKMTSSRERMLRWVFVAVIAVAIFGGLYWVVMMMEGS